MCSRFHLLFQEDLHIMITVTLTGLWTDKLYQFILQTCVTMPHYVCVYLFYKYIECTCIMYINFFYDDYCSRRKFTLTNIPWTAKKTLENYFLPFLWKINDYIYRTWLIPNFLCHFVLDLLLSFSLPLLAHQRNVSTYNMYNRFVMVNWKSIFRFHCNSLANT